MTRHGLAGFVLFTALAPAAAGEGPLRVGARDGPAAFPAGVESVVVDAVVLDGANRPVGGLLASDFVVLEDGVPQALTSFEAVSAPAARIPTSAAPASVSSNAEPGRPGRTFVVVFDDLHLTPFLAGRAREQLARFVAEALGPGDRIAVALTSGRLGWTARLPSGRAGLLAWLAGLEGLRRPDTSPEALTAYEAVRIHRYRDTEVGERVRRRFRTSAIDIHDQLYRQRERGTDSLPGVNHPFVEARAAQVYAQARENAASALSALRRVMEGLAGRRGRPSVVLVSEGFVHDPSLPAFAAVREAAQKATAAIHFLDARGLVAAPASAFAEYGPPLVERDLAFAVHDVTLEAEGPESVAMDSGGSVVRNTNDMAAGLLRIASESREYYLLGYTTAPARPGETFRRIEVRVARPGLRVRARRGYRPGAAAGRPQPSSADADALARELEAPFEATGVGLRLAALVLGPAGDGKVRVVLVTDVGPFTPAGGSDPASAVEHALLLMNAGTREALHHRQRFELSAEDRATLARSGSVPLARAFELRPGRYQARAAVREAGGNRFGSVVHSFDVPEPGAWRVSTPLLSDTLLATAGPPRPLAIARRAFEPGSTLYCAFDVYGSARDGATGLPRVSAGYALRDLADGTTRRARPPTAIASSPEGGVSRLLGLPLAELGPGEFELVLSVRDEVSGRAEVIREGFEVTAAAP